MSMVMTTSMAVYSPCLCLHDVHTPARNLEHCSNGATTAFSSVSICNSRIFFSDKKNITCIRSLARTEPRGPNFCRNSWNSSNLQAAAEGGLILECEEDDGELSLCEDSHSEKLYSEIQPSTTTCGCKVCRRNFFGAFGALLSLTSPAMADSSAGIMSNAQKVMEEVHPPRPGWYEEFYAISLDHGMKSYEAEIAGWKMQLLNQLKGEAERVLELGIGTGTNLKYYAGGANVSVVGVDPNKHMEKYAQAAATAAGLAKSQFKFIQGVGEALPILGSSMDAVVCTLVLCSVKDVAMTLKGKVYGLQVQRAIQTYNCSSYEGVKSLYSPQSAARLLQHHVVCKSREGAETRWSVHLCGTCGCS